MEDPAEVIKHTEDLLGRRDPLYKRRPMPIPHEECDTTYFQAISAIERRKVSVGVFGAPNAGKRSLAALMNKRNILNRGENRVSMRSGYEIERDMPIHPLPLVVFCDRSRGSSKVVTLVDAPGHIDFVLDAVGIVENVDIAVLLIDIRHDLCMQDRIVLERCRDLKRPVIVILNKADRLIRSADEERMMEKVEYLKSEVSRITEVTRFLLGSLKEGCAIRSEMDRVMDEEDSIDRLIDVLFVDSIFDHQHIDEDISYNPRTMSTRSRSGITGHVLVNNQILCGVIARRPLEIGELYNSSRIEAMYIYTSDHLVSVKSCASNVGVLISCKTSSPIKNEISITDELWSCGRGERLWTEDRSMQQPQQIKVAIRPRSAAGYEGAIQKLMLLFPSMRVDGCVVSGTGELYLDAVFYYLSAVFGIEHEKMSVYVGLREMLIEDFEERLEINGSEVMLRGGARGDTELAGELGPVEEELVRTGPLVGERIVNAYLEVKSSIRSEELGEHLMRLREGILRHTGILEPFYKVEAMYADVAEDVVFELARKYDGIIGTAAIPSTKMRRAVFYMPMAEAFGFETDLRVYSCGRALCSRMFCGWGRVRDKEREGELIKSYRETKHKMLWPCG
jgi:small GTP-binding protein